MRRTPGTPTDTVALLSGIDETSLRHLVADILYFYRSPGPSNWVRATHAATAQP